MKARLIPAALALMLVAPIVCAHGEEKHEAAKMAAGRETAKAELTIAPAAVDAVAAVERFSVALGSDDLAKAGAELDPNVLILESGGVERSREEYLGGHAKSDAAFLKGAHITLQRRTAQASGDMAWVGSESEIHAMKGDKMLMIASTETMVLRKTDQGWKIVHIHWSSRNAAPAKTASTSKHSAHTPATLTGLARPADAPQWMEIAETQAIATGAGFGMASAAEAHALPGPKHVLELADALGLTTTQRERMQQLLATMKREAIRQGRAVLAAESALDKALALSPPDGARVAALAEAAGRARGLLRLVHLAAHLDAAPLLTQAQIARYVTLRNEDGV